MNEQHYRRSLGMPYDLDAYLFESANGMTGYTTPEPEEPAYSPEGSDLYVEQSAANGDLLTAELELYIYECQLAATYDAEAEKEVRIAASFLESIKAMQEEGIAFEGNTQEELDAVVELMQQANPEADQEELVNLVYEMVNYVQELRRQPELTAAID